MAPSDNVAVVITPPSFDLDPYKPFDEELFGRTVDEILSEEASLEESRRASEQYESFDFGNDGTYGSSGLNASRRKGKAKESPFFSTPPFAPRRKPKKTYATKRSITMVDLETDGEEGVDAKMMDERRTDNVSSEADGSSGDQLAYDLNAAVGDMMQSSTSGPGPLIDRASSVDDDQIAEDAVFASLTLSQRDHLIQFIVSHPFMGEYVQPVRRSARRQFTDQVRVEAAQAGMDEAAIASLIDYVRSSYRDLHGMECSVTTTERDGSAFGDEIDDEDKETTRDSSSKCPKRSLDGAVMEKSKRSKRRHSDGSRVPAFSPPRGKTMQVVIDHSGGIFSKPQGDEDGSGQDELAPVEDDLNVSADLDQSNQDEERQQHVEGPVNRERVPYKCLDQAADFTIFEEEGSNEENIPGGRFDDGAPRFVLKESACVPESPQPKPEAPRQPSLMASETKRWKEKKDREANIHDRRQPGAEAPGSSTSQVAKNERKKRARKQKQRVKKLRDRHPKSELDHDHSQVQVSTPTASPSIRKSSNNSERRSSCADLSLDPTQWDVDF